MKIKLKLVLIICCGLLLTKGVISQNITNTLGTTGLFKIKDGVSTFLTLTQSNGYVELTKSLKLPVTTDQNTGVIYKGLSPFMHDYKNPNNIGDNTFIGVNSGNFTLGGSGQVGYGSHNTAVGYNSLNALTTGYSNVALGTNALQLNTTGHSNIAIGSGSLASNTSGFLNISLGKESLFSNTSGTQNLGLGYQSLLYNTTGFNNVAVGNSSLQANTIGGENTAIGRSTLVDNTTGYSNTALGSLALANNTTGTYNTAVGYNSGSNAISGFNLTLLGYQAQSSTSGASNQITLGNNQITSLRCNVQTITSLSDARDKRDIRDLSLGLDFLMMLKPRQFNWDRREWYEGNKSDGSKMQQALTAGFVAQELDSVQIHQNAEWLNLVLKDNPEKLEATYGNLLPVMVKAIQELKEENDRLKKQIEALQSIEERLTMIELTVLKDAVLREIKMSEK